MRDDDKPNLDYEIEEDITEAWIDHANEPLQSDLRESLEEPSKELNKVLKDESYSPENIKNYPDLKRKYDRIYHMNQKMASNIDNMMNKNETWRKRTWMWRIISFILGIIFGLITHLFI